MPGLASSFNFVLRVVDQGATSTIRKFSAQVDRTTSAGRSHSKQLNVMSASARGYTAHAATAGAAAFTMAFAIQRSLRAFAEYEEKMRAVQLVSQATKRQFDEISGSVQKLVGVTEFLPSQLAEASRLLAQAGLSSQEVAKGLGAVADVTTAAFGGLEIKDAASLFINVSKGFQLEGDKAATAMDKLVRVTQLSPLAMDDVSTSLGFATAAAAAFGQTLDTTLVSLAALIPITRTASKAGTALRAGINALFRPTGKRILEDQLGISAVDKTTGEAKDILGLVQEVDKAIKKLPRAQRKFTLTQLFGVRGLQLYAAVMRATVKGSGDLKGVTLRGADAIEEMSKQLKNVNADAARFAQEQRETLGKAMERLSSGISGVSIALGKGFAPIVQTSASSMAELTIVFKDYLQWMDGAPAKIGAVTAAVAGLTLGVQAAWVGMQALSLWTGRAMALAGMGGAARGIVGRITGTGAVGGLGSLMGVDTKAGSFLGPAQMQMRAARLGVVPDSYYKTQAGTGKLSMTRDGKYFQRTTRLSAAAQLTKNSFSRAAVGAKNVAKGFGNLLGPLGLLIANMQIWGLVIQRSMEAWTLYIGTILTDQRTERIKKTFDQLGDLKDFLGKALADGTKFGTAAAPVPLEQLDRLIPNFDRLLPTMIQKIQKGEVTTMTDAMGFFTDFLRHKIMLQTKGEEIEPEVAAKLVKTLDAIDHRAQIADLKTTTTMVGGRAVTKIPVLRSMYSEITDMFRVRARGQREGFLDPSADISDRRMMKMLGNITKLPGLRIEIVEGDRVVMQKVFDRATGKTQAFYETVDANGNLMRFVLIPARRGAFVHEEGG